MYCSQCGAEIEKEAHFCGECGAEVEQDDVTAVNQPVSAAKSFGVLESDIFENSDWKARWLAAAQKASGLELGIILTDVSALSKDLSCSTLQIKELIANYIAAAHQRDVHYYLLDIAENSVQNVDGCDVQAVVDLLKMVCDVARPKYLFILGNETIVNVAIWDNQTNDWRDDADILADLPYVTLDTTSPWEGQKYNFGQVLRTGRLPSYPGEKLSDFANYFNNAIKGIGSIDKIEPFGLSNIVWESQSQSQYSKIDPGSVYTSPDVTNDDVNEYIPRNVNLLYFNLHGSDTDKHWGGENPFGLVEAFSPDSIRALDTSYFLGVEACYGARYTDGLTPDDSILLSAMQCGCLAFLGSSRIAFAPNPPTPGLADFMIGTFIKKITEGESAGDAYCAAMSDVMADDKKDACTIKTLAEFSLYGDPSARTGKNKSKSILGKAFGGVAKGLRVPMPDVRRAVKSVQIDANCKAVQAFQSKLSTKTKAFGTGFNIMDYMQAEDARYYQEGNQYRASYCKSLGSMKQIAHVYFDDDGKIVKTYISK